MQEKAGQFRSAAFGGFHRQDVLHYIEQLTREHQANCERLERELTEERTARQQAEERLRLGEYYQNQDFVFSQDSGKPMHPDSVTDWLKKFSKRHGLPHINAHAFRHTMASML